ncbi:MAG: hypothetical protein QOI24_611 [Acidobacteriota bacterium]|jgi:hypothetical protein|nr:hypothetical protein [Acidobacteriota bacterium]
MTAITDTSPRLTARLAGFFWLMTIITGIFAFVAASGLVVFGDVAATATNLLAHEPLFRSALSADLVATVCYVAATIFVYELLKAVNGTVSLLAAFFSLIGCSIGAFGVVLRIAPLVVLRNSQYLGVFAAEQQHAMAYLFLRIYGQSSSVSFVFFGLHCFLIGCLILRSTFLPRFIGVLILIAGAGWLTQGFTNLLSPTLGRSLSSLLMPLGILGEGSLTLWLLIAGVNIQRWRDQNSDLTHLSRD